MSLVPALLPWQLLLLAYGAGIWMLREPWAGLCALVLIALCNRLAGRVSPRPAILVLAALTGLAWAWLRLPPMPHDPAWLDSRPKGSLSAQVAEVAEKPDGRLEILLENAVFHLEDGSAEPLSGSVAWTWQYPALRPAPGSTVRLATRPHATTGFDNPGGVDWAWNRRLHGVFYRVFTLGQKGVEFISLAPPSPAEAWRLRLRQAILDGAAGRRVHNTSAPPSDTPHARVSPDIGDGPSRAAGLSGTPDESPDTNTASQPDDQQSEKSGLLQDSEQVASLDRTSCGEQSAKPKRMLNAEQGAKPARLPGNNLGARPGPTPDGEQDETHGPILEGTASPGSAAGMVLGLITGERFAISRADLDMVRRASLSHLLAVSGMNLAAVVAMGWCLAVLAGLVWPGLYLRIPRPKLAVLLGLPLAVCYLWLARFEPSLMRAALMFCCWALLLLYNRSRILLDGLMAALAIMLLYNPLEAFNVGLQLSAAAVAGLILLLPVASPLLRRLRISGRWWAWPIYLLAGWALVTLCCQLAVLPIQAQVFGEASPHLYLNLLWVPVVEWLAQPPAYIGALTVLWLPSVGGFLLHASATVCDWMLMSLKAMDTAGFLEIFPIRRPLWPELLGYVLLIGGLAYSLRLPLRRRLAWLALCLVLLGAPSVFQFWSDSRNRVSLTMLDVGQGQSLLLQLPGGRRYLVDGGGVSSGNFDIGQAVLAPALTWGRRPRLDGIILSHPDRDHAGGITFPLAHFRVGFLAGNGQWPANGEFSRALTASRLTPQAWKAGDVLELGDGLALEVLHPPGGYSKRGNEASLVLRLTWNGRGLAILPGDAGSDALSSLAASGRDLSASVLVTPHHGSKTALAPGFYDKVGAGLALISSGRGNAFGLPSPQVTQTLAGRGTTLLNTAFRGALTVRWAGPLADPEVVSQR